MPARVLRRALALVAGAAALAPLPAAAEGPPPEPPRTGWQGTVCGTTIPIPLTVAGDVDDAGVVVGHDARNRATSWNSRTGAYRWFGGIEGGLPSTLTAVSGAGRVAGLGTIDGPSLDPSKAVRVEGPLPLRAISRSLRTHDQVADVNDANVVVGTSEVLGSTWVTEAFVWTDRRYVLPKPDPSYRLLHARSVNEAGWVLGGGYRPDAAGTLRHLVLIWRPDRTVVELPPLPDGAMFIAEHIDESGRAIGHRLLDDGVGDAVAVWSPYDGYTFDASPGGSLQVTAADDKGLAIGTVIDPTTGAAQPFHYERAGMGFRRMTVLGGAPLDGVPYGMSEATQVLVAGRGGSRLWTPCTTAERERGR